MEANPPILSFTFDEKLNIEDDRNPKSQVHILLLFNF